jgi:hypothetical protein
MRNTHNDGPATRLRLPVRRIGGHAVAVLPAKADRASAPGIPDELPSAPGPGVPGRASGWWRPGRAVPGTGDGVELLSVSVSVGPAYTLVRLAGEGDVTVCDQLRGVLAAQVQAGARNLVVDPKLP